LRLNIFDVLTRSLRILENQVTRNRMRLEPPDILIQPAVGGIQTLEFHKSAAIIAAGAAAVDEQLADLKSGLAALAQPAG
jgi:NTE family protein